MKKIITLLAVVMFITSCQKTPGTGGKAIINVHVVDGNSNVGYTDIQIKYGASSYPGENATYDAKIVGDNNGKNKFTNLKRGDYYVYSSYTDSLGNIKEGGAYVKINNKPGEQHIVIDFGEADPF